MRVSCNVYMAYSENLACRTKGDIMSKLVLVFALFASNASAAYILLEKHATNGQVIPENSFKKDCSIFREMPIGFM
jgi:hypothetical protein